jgi:PPP family 3-phenylpropionic acid transporter
MKTNPQITFNDLTFARLYYFTFMGGWGFVLPFVNLFYVSLGFSGKQIGLITSISAVVGMIASPLWVSEVKKHPHARRILQAALILGALGYYVIGSQTSFLFIIILVFLHALAASGIMPLSDSMAVMVASESGNGYGSVRVWASLGWIASVLSSGWLVARFGYVAGFGGVCLMWITASVIVLFIQPRFFSQPLVDQPKRNLSVALDRIRQDRTLLGFAIALIAIGFLNSGVLQFENVFLGQLGASKLLISVAGILSAIVELPCMIYADKVLHRVGAHRLMLGALIMILLQRLVVITWPYIATIMIVRFIGGISFSFYTITFVGLISSRTQTSETGTLLAMFTVTIAGLVNIIASPVSGALFDALGARWLYVFSAAGYMIGVLCLWWTRPRDVQANALIQQHESGL